MVRLAVSRSRLLCGVLQVLLFVLGLALSLAALEPLLPARGGDFQRTKLDHFRRHKDEIDTLFLGTSTIYRGFDPGQFDRLTSDGGRPTRTFNLGLPGFFSLGYSHLLEEVLEMNPARLRWILIQMEGVPADRLQDDTALTPPVIAWHDLEGTLSACEFCRSHGLSSWVEFGLVWDQWESFAHRLLNVHRAQSWIEALLGVGPSVAERALWIGVGGNGFQALDETSARGAERHDRFLLPEVQQRYRDQIAGWRDGRGWADPPAEVLVEHCRRMDERLASASVQLLFVTLAGAYHGSPAVVAHERGLVDTLLSYDDVVRFPDLFDPRLRFDSRHFTREGARVFTAQIAEDFLRQADER